MATKGFQFFQIPRLNLVFAHKKCSQLLTLTLKSVFSNSYGCLPKALEIATIIEREQSAPLSLHVVFAFFPS